MNHDATLEQGFDVDALEVRAANETSAKLAAQADEQVGVKKNKGKKKGGNRKRAERSQRLSLIHI